MRSLGSMKKLLVFPVGLNPGGGQVHPPLRKENGGANGNGGSSQGLQKGCFTVRKGVSWPGMLPKVDGKTVS